MSEGLAVGQLRGFEPCSAAHFVLPGSPGNTYGTGHQISTYLSGQTWQMSAGTLAANISATADNSKEDASSIQNVSCGAAMRE